MISGFRERVPEPQNQLFLFFETPGYLKKTRKLGTIQTYYLHKSQNVGNPKCCQNRRRRGPENDEDPFKKSWNPGDGTNIYQKTRNGNKNEETKRLLKFWKLGTFQFSKLLNFMEILIFQFFGNI